MSVDGVGNVLEESAHFDRKSPFADKFTDVGSNTLDAENSVVVFSGRDPNESCCLLGFLGQCTTVCSQWELTGNDRMSSCYCFIG